MDGQASSCSLHAEKDRLLLSVAGINSTPISYVGDLRALYIVCFVFCCENVTLEAAVPAIRHKKSCAPASCLNAGCSST